MGGKPYAENNSDDGEKDGGRQCQERVWGEGW